MKKWQEPEISNIEFKTTESTDACPYADETPQPMTLFPVIVWGDGKIGCTYWNCSPKGCSHPSYGSKGRFWPCPQQQKATIS